MRIWAWLVAAAVAVACVVALAADARLSENQRGWFDLLTEAALSTALVALGLVLVARSSAGLIGGLLLGLALTLSGVSAVDAVLAGLVERGYDANRLVRAGLALGSASWVVLFGLLTTLALVFPTGRPATRRWGAVLVVSLVAYALTIVSIVLSDSPNPDVLEDVPGPFPSVPNWVWIGLFAIGWPLTLASLAAGAASVVIRFRRAEGVERLQLKWFAWSAATVPVTLAVCGATWVATGEFQDALIGVLVTFCVLLPATAVTIAITRYRLYEIDTIVNRTLVYGALTILLAGVWLTASVLLGVAAGAGSAWATAGATLAAAALFSPLRRRVQNIVDRRLDRPRWDALREIRAFENDVRAGTADPEGIERVLRDVLADASLRLLYRRADGAFTDVSGSGPDVSRAATPVCSRGEEVAVLDHDPVLLGRPRLVEAVMQAAGLTIEFARLQIELRHQLDELAESRARIVAAGYEERRRLERDLHDGAQQRLVSLGIRLRRIQRTLPPDARVLAPALDAAVDEIGATIADLRTIAAGVRPPRLDSGLRAALEDLAQATPLPVEVDVPRERLPSRVEAAAYYIACEALTNAVKHARPTQVRIAATRDAGRLTLVVVDDGVGGAAPGAGSGLLGLADRVGAHGGQLEIHSPSGRGTTVVAEIPCDS